jgi:uncharacterized membrane protein YeaQ/YmgE (transglycosylase-associated protein family)
MTAEFILVATIIGLLAGWLAATLSPLVLRTRD